MADGIAYQNKDILFKVLCDEYKSKTFKVYGLDLPPIKEMLPADLPMITADEQRCDNLFLLEDGSLMIIDYKSSSSLGDIFQLGAYGFRAADAYFTGKAGGVQRRLNLVVIYTGNVESAPDQYDMDSIVIKVKQVFLSKFDGDAIYEDLKLKVTAGEPLTDEDVMRFIILPLTDKKGSPARVREMMELAKKVKADRQQIFIIAGLLTATDKFIDREYADKVREWLKMTKVARLYEEEKIEALTKVAKLYEEEKLEALTKVSKLYEEDKLEALTKASKLYEEEKLEALTKASKLYEEEKLEAVINTEAQTRRQVAQNLLKGGAGILLIMKATGLTRKEIESMGDDANRVSNGTQAL
ncbi:MAG: transcriptional regulator [Clostridiales bacterium]|nr:transcriptional regulator [Clostridiales bacterium]